MEANSGSKVRDHYLCLAKILRHSKIVIAIEGLKMPFKPEGLMSLPQKRYSL